MKSKLLLLIPALPVLVALIVLAGTLIMLIMFLAWPFQKLWALKSKNHIDTAQGCNDQEACFLADISPSVFYNYQKRYPAFRERKDALKTRPVIIARKSVNDAMKDDGWLAMKYLQQKRPEEFGGDNPVPAVTLNISFEKKVSNYLSENADAKQHILTIAKFLKEPDGPQQADA